MADREYILQQVKRTIRLLDPSAEVILYGSQAKGTALVDSDWDILVLTETEHDHAGKREIRNAVHAIELETGEVISVIIHSKDYWQMPRNLVTPFYKNINRDSITL